MVGNLHSAIPNDQFQGYWLSGNNNSNFMTGVPVFTHAAVNLSYSHMLAIQSAHLKAMASFFQGQDAVFSPINNTIQFPDPQVFSGVSYSHQKNMDEIPAGTLPNHVADYGPDNKFSGSVPEYNCPAGTLPNHVADYGPDRTGLSQRDELVQNDHIPSDTDRPGSYRNNPGLSQRDELVQNTPSKKHSRSVHKQSSSHSDYSHQKDITREEFEANVTAREASAPVYITGDDGKISTYYPNGDGTYYKQTRTGGAEHDRAGNVKVYQRSHVTDADGELQDAFMQI